MSSKQSISIFRKIYKKGPSWFFLRIRHEFRQPTLKLVQDAMVAFEKINRRLKSIFFKDEKGDTDYVTAVYDLNVMPVTYDFAAFLAGAELFALKNKKSSFFVLFVPRRDDQFLEVDYRLALGEDSIKWRFENIVLPMMNIYPACIGHSLIPKTSAVSEAIKGKFLYPEFYSERLPEFDCHPEVYASKNMFSGFSASTQGKRYIESWIKKNNITGKIVTITLRQYIYDPIRNSNVGEWVKFAQFAMEKGFTPVFIPDTDACFEREPRLNDFIVFEAPCWNLGLRMAFYEEADLNFFTSNGPVNIVTFNKIAASVIMKHIVPGSVNNNAELHAKRGIGLGQRTYDLFDDHYQILVWGDDTFENICEEFNKFLAVNCST